MALAGSSPLSSINSPSNTATSCSCPLDVDKVAPVAQKYSIRAMPTFIFFKNGERADDMTGANKVGLEGKVKMLAA
nr:thioredoxin family protein [Streptomyces sp. A3M-1-3]